MARRFSTTKQPSELFPIGVDFAADLDTSETVSSAAVTAIDTADDSDVSATVLSGSPSISDGDQTDSIVSQKVQAGSDGSKYKITFLATTSDSNIYEADVFVKVKEL